MYMTFAESRFNLADFMWTEYGVTRIDGYEMVGEYAHSEIAGEDFSKVIILLKTDMNRFLLFLDTETLKPDVSVVYNEADILALESLTGAFLAIPLSGNHIKDTPQGFSVGPWYFDPTNLGSPGNLGFISPLNNPVVVREDLYGTRFEGSGQFLYVDRYPNTDSSGVISNYYVYSANNESMYILDAEVDSSTKVFRILLQLTLLSGDKEVRLLSFPSIDDVVAQVSGSNLIDVPGVVIQPFPSIDFDPFSGSSLEAWITEDYLVVSFRDRGDMTSFNFDGTKHRSFRFASDLARVINFDPGFNGEVRWWLMYEHSTGFLYKNRVWW